MCLVECFCSGFVQKYFEVEYRYVHCMNEWEEAMCWLKMWEKNKISIL